MATASVNMKVSISELEIICKALALYEKLQRERIGCAADPGWGLSGDPRHECLAAQNIRQQLQK